MELQVQLAATSYVEIRVEQVRGDVAVTLANSQGDLVASSDLHGRQPETLAAVTTMGGTHYLRFEASKAEAARFRLAKFEERPATDRDGILLAALALWQQALRLKGEQTEDSTQSGMELMASAAGMLAGSGFAVHEGRIRRELGDCLSTRGLVEKAEGEYLAAIDLLESGGEASSLAEALNSYGDLLTNRGERDRAERLYDRALTLATRADDVRLQAFTWNNLGVLYYHRGELDRAVESFEKALDLQVAGGAEHYRANILGNLGSAYRALGRYGDALKVSESALALARGLDDKQQELGILNSRGVWLKAVGDIRAATDAYVQALDLVELLGARDMEATVSGNLGTLYRLLGQEDRARSFLERSLASATEVGSASDQSWALLALGQVAREAGDERAIDYYREAKDLAVEAGDRFSTAHGLLGLGHSYLDFGRPLEAVDALTEALNLQETISDRPGQVAVLRELARAQGILGEARTARANFERAIELSLLVGEPSKEAQARFRYAEFLVEEGELEVARRQAAAATQTIESLRQGVVQPDSRAGLLSRSHQDFALLVEILARLEEVSPGQGYAEAAFGVAERARARALVEYLTEARAELAQDVPSEFQKSLEDITGRLSRMQQKLTRELRESTVNGETVDELKVQIRTLDQERADLWREIRVADPRWASLQYPEPLDVSQARNLLGEDQALVSFVLGERKSYVFLISASDFVIRALPSETELTPLVQEVGSLLEEPGRRNLGRFRVAASRLYDLLLEPLEEETTKYEHLLVAADGILHYLPFEALVLDAPSPDAVSYLISKWAVSYVPSASVFEALARHRPERSPSDGLQLAAFADPNVEGSAGLGEDSPGLQRLDDGDTRAWQELDGARAEVAAIASFFEPSRTRVFVGDDASEASFKTSSAVRDARYLHVASHALIDNQQSALSALMLAAERGGPDDGLLQTHEVFDLELSADLVVLSGCETALGRAVRGEGLIGLTRAFLYAGAGAVSVSLWPVEDQSTARLMTAFYRELDRGLPAAQALREAKLNQARVAQTSHPYYWASFVLIGAPS